MLTTEEKEAAARVLWDAEHDRAPIPPLVDTYPAIDVVDSYEIQLINIRKRQHSTEIVGHKVGLSSLAMQKMMGVDEPDYGHLLADMRCSEDVPADASRYCYPRVEVEVGFVLNADLPGEKCTEEDVVAATELVFPSIELIDSRIVDWKIGLADTIADNASSAGFVLGKDSIKLADVDIKSIDAVLWRNGENAGEGRSDAVLGNPVTSVAWLARKVASFGVQLRAGHVILPGSCMRAVDVAPGDDFRADLSIDGRHLGSVHLSFQPTSD